MDEFSVQITLREGTGYLTGVPGDVMEKIRQATQFRPAGYQYSRAYKTFVPGAQGTRKRKWDGYIRLTKHSKFPGGLIHRVLAVLEDAGIEPTIVQDDPREFPEIDLSTAGIEQRWYQEKAIEQALLRPRGILRAPTGSGKSAIACEIVAGHRRRALIIVPTIDLLYQMKRFLENYMATPDGGIGQLGDGVVDPKEVTVATVRTAAKVVNVAYESYEFGEYDDKDNTAVAAGSMRDWVQGIGTVIVDEGHILGAQAVYDIVTRIPAMNKYAMSASPWRDDGADLMIEAATGPIIYRIGTKELVADGWLVPPIIQTIDTKGLWRPAAWKPNEFQKAYAKEIVENPIRNKLVAYKAIDLQERSIPTLLLVRQVKHGRILQDMIPGSVFISGSATSDERNAVYDAMRNGDLNTVICTSIADMGLDLPVCEALILAGGGKSSTRHLQRIGRVARPYPGKQSALVIDLDDTHVHRWFAGHAKARRKIERAEWADCALWI